MSGSWASRPVAVSTALNGRCHLAGLAMHRAGRPVALADFIEHGAANARFGEGGETRALRRIVAARGFQQTQHAGLDQIVHLHRCRQPRQQVVGNALDLRRAPGDEIVRRVAAETGVQGKTFHPAHSSSEEAGLIRRSMKNCR